MNNILSFTKGFLVKFKRMKTRNELLKHPVCIPASNLIHALIMNGVFSVLFKERCQSVLCVISESFCLCVCLFVLIYTVSQKVLTVHFHGDVSRKSFSALAIPWSW